VWQATRSKSLIDLLYQAGHYISYNQVRHLDTTLTTENVEKFAEHNNTLILSNIEHGKFCQYAADNIDLVKETLDGMGTFHATQMVVYQRVSSQKQKKDLPLGKAKSLKVPPELHQLECVLRLPAREDPRFDEDVTEDMFIPDYLLTDEAFAKDVSWILSRVYGFKN